MQRSQYSETASWSNSCPKLVASFARIRLSELMLDALYEIARSGRSNTSAIDALGQFQANSRALDRVVQQHGWDQRQ